jgi:hypothetical protein
LGLRRDIVARIFAKQFATKPAQRCVIVDVQSARQLMNIDTDLRRAPYCLLQNSLRTPIDLLEDSLVQLF